MEIRLPFLHRVLTISQSPAVPPAQAEADKWLQEFRQAFQSGDIDHAAGALKQLKDLLHAKH